MNVDEVLLTDSEIEDEVAGDAWLDDMSWVCKAQCLKLLEWLKERCEEHPILIPAEYGVIEPSGYAYVCRFECPECMSELESKLKEG